VPIIQLQGVGDYWSTPDQKIALILLLAVCTSLGVHALGLSGSYESSMNPMWLFTLIPLTALLYRLLSWDILAFAPPAAFVYSNIFVALQWRSLAYENGLTSMHLISGALIFSIGCLILLLRFIPRKIVDHNARLERTEFEVVEP
jgi:hypothetical protein